MSPKPFASSQYDHVPHTNDCACDPCADARFKARNPHLYGHTEKPGLNWPLTRWLRLLLASLLIVATLLGLSWAAQQAFAREGAIHPIKAPASLVKARAACPDNKPLACRAALVRAYQGLEWQREQNLKLAREMLGNVTNWTCIHGHEGAWNDRGDPYWGGLQMDKPFMRTYGADMIRRHHGGLANVWTPREQIIVAQRAFSQNRGYHPWPNTARACGLL